MKGYPTVYNGVIFIETPEAAGERVAAIAADLSFRFGAQLKNLNDVKADMAAKAAYRGCNCVSEFKYGQKSRWLAIDDVAYFGKGIAVRLPKETYGEIMAYIESRDAR